MHSVSDVKAVLSKTGKLLADSDMPCLRYFNEAYLAITVAVEENIKQKSFADPDFLHKFDVRFAWYYLAALRDYLQGTTVAPAWQNAFDYCKEDKLQPARALALGVNAHVNNDIPQSLVDCNFQNSHKADYFLVNKIIGQQISKILDTIESTSKFQRFYYHIGMRVIIRAWRHSCWSKALKLKARKLDTDHVEDRAELISKTARDIPPH